MRHDELDASRGIVGAVLVSVVFWCVVVLLAGCGGSGEDPGTAAEAAAKSGTQPVNCAGVTGLQCQ